MIKSTSTTQPEISLIKHSARNFFLLATVLWCATSLPAQIESTAPAPTLTPAPPTVPRIKVPHKPFPIEERYAFFIRVKAGDHDFIQREIWDDPKRFAPDVEEQNMSVYIGIRSDEYRIIVADILDARDRLSQDDKEVMAALHKFQQENGGALQAAKVAPPPELIEVSKHHNAIIDGMIDKLKHELGDESFAKLNAYVDEYFGGRTYELVPGPAKVSSQLAPAENPVSTQTPAVRP
jgi:hypothetical protein